MRASVSSTSRVAASRSYWSIRRLPWPLIQTSSVWTSSFSSVAANTRSIGPSVHMLAS